jgi:hypothetical protein
MADYADFDKYQAFTKTTAVYPDGVALAYTACGLIGESCEYAGKLAKVVETALKQVEVDFRAADQKGRDEMLSQIDNLRKLRVILGEAVSLGNAAEKFKKALRSGEKKIPPLPSLSEEERLELDKESGDIHWYLSESATARSTKLSKVIELNVEKLTSRKERGVIQGDGDNR